LITRKHIIPKVSFWATFLSIMIGGSPFFTEFERN
jgi:hypothetical protein